MSLWILYAGSLQSDEPESYESLRLQEEAQRAGQDVRILNPDLIDLVVDDHKGWQARYGDETPPLPGFILPRTGAETSYTAYSVMRFYELQGASFLNTPKAINAAADKLHTQQLLAAAGLPVPKTMLAKFPVDSGFIGDMLGFPVIIKTLRGTRGGGVFLAENREQFRDLTDLLAESNPNIHFIFQEYIGTSHGADLRVFIADGRVLACMKRVAAEGSFKSNISRGGTGTPYPITSEIEKLALRTAATLELDVAGIDLLFDKDGRFRICEANSSPGFAGLEKACTVNAAEAIIKAVGKKRHRTKRTSWLSFLGRGANDPGGVNARFTA